MNKYTPLSSTILVIVFILYASLCNAQNDAEHLKSSSKADFPSKLVDFVSYAHNPVFSGTDSDTWDTRIRERGYILVEDGIYKMWYSGGKGGLHDPNFVGYATSTDGIHWTSDPKNPIFDKKWTEDMFVLKVNGLYYMYAEGANYKGQKSTNDIAHLLTSPNGINWQEKGNLILINTKGDTLPAPYGTPSVIIANDKWYLFYERNDKAIWLATRTNNDPRTWTNVSDDPVLKPGPGSYDSRLVACDQVVKYKGKYYMYYHGTSTVRLDKPGRVSIWTSDVAMSTDLIHWVKYSKNPIVQGDHSSPILVQVGNGYRLYTMHRKVWMYLHKE